MWLLIAFLFLLGAVSFLVISLICKMKDNGKAVKNLIRAILCLVLFVVAMSFDETSVEKEKQNSESEKQRLGSRSLLCWNLHILQSLLLLIYNSSSFHFLE